MKKQYRRMRLWLCLLVSAVFAGVILFVLLSAAHRENEKLLSEIEIFRNTQAFYFSSVGDLDLDAVLEKEDVDRERLLLGMTGFYNAYVTAEKRIDSFTEDNIHAEKYQAVVDKDGKIYHFPTTFLEIREAPRWPSSYDAGSDGKGGESSETTDDAYPELRRYPYSYFVPIPDDVVQQIYNDYEDCKIDINTFLFQMQGRITGVREGNIVFAKTLELFTVDGSGMVRYDISYDFCEAPKNGIPFTYENLGTNENNDAFPATLSVGTLDDGAIDAVCERKGVVFYYPAVNGVTRDEANRRHADQIRSRKENTAKAVEALLGRFDINSGDWIIRQYGTYWDAGLFTSRWYTTSSIGYETNGWIPNLVLCYEIHPLKTAWEQSKTSVIALFVIWAGVLAAVLLLVKLLQKRHEQFERSRVTLTRAAAHELKTPLAVLRTYAENWNILGESERAACAKDMVSRIDHVNSLVGNILELSRLESDAKEMHPEMIALPELNSVVLSQLSVISGGKEISVNAPENAEDAVVKGDLSMIRTVLLNLVTNAIRYGDRKIAIDISKKKDAVRYQITNDGAPIPADKLPHIWDAFYCADESRSKDTKSNCGNGTGLGLAVTKQILEIHKARFGCESGADGTVFWFEM